MIKHVCRKSGSSMIPNSRKNDKTIYPRRNTKISCDKDKRHKNFASQIKIKKVVTLILILSISIFTIYFLVLPTVQGNLHFLIVLSGSMEPSIHVGDIVISSKTNTKDLKEGDIITFRYEGEKYCITHRVFKIIDTEFGTFFKTKGDANEEEDTRLVRENEIIGKVILVIPYLGYLPAFAKTTLGYVTLIVIPGLLIIINELMRIRAEILRRRLSK